MKPHTRTLLDDDSVIEVSDIIEEGDVVTGGSVEWLVGDPSDGALHGVHLAGGYAWRVHLPNVRDGVARSGRCCGLAVEGDYYTAQTLLKEAT